ncbi:hypothetical protein OH76DRAFT_1476026 [Lentinus brumalis]|uniref:Uncharacterized protein n=1 Tax=Lentinus brumalis TaxID=2498619 RepID=A0A371CKR6_9APHY|nr:hypothetical protein OH76DRAFT_1476026 [Polyporus brumalis]
MQSKAVHDTTVRTIEDLNSTIRSIRQAFHKVREDLQRFDNEGHRGENGVMLQLSPEWDTLQGHLHQILDTSRDNAAEAAAYMRQFTVSMLEDVDESDYATLKDEISIFKALMLAETKLMDRKATKGFSQLVDDVYLFANRIDLVVEDEDVHIKDTLHAAQHRISDLHFSLEQISSDTTKMAAECLASFATTALGVGLAVVTLSPDAFVLAITSAVASGHSNSQLIKLRHSEKYVKQELKTCSKEIMRLMDQDDTLCHYKVSLIRTPWSDMKELSSKITTFDYIWQSLKTDIFSLKKQVSPKLNTTKLFQKKIASTRELYNTLIFLLEQYARGSVDKEGEETLSESDDENDMKNKSES